MAESEKIPVAVYQVDLTKSDVEEFTAVVDIIIKKAATKGKKFNKEKISAKKFPGFKLSVFSAVTKHPPKWRLFLSAVVDKQSKLLKAENKTHSFICFIEYE